MRLWVDEVGRLRTTGRLYGLLGQPVEIHQKVERGLYSGGHGQVRPIPLVDIAAGEPVLQIALADLFYNCLGRFGFCCFTGSVNAPGV
jgi:hypothetical protein